MGIRILYLQRIKSLMSLNDIIDTPNSEEWVPTGLTPEEAIARLLTSTTMDKPVDFLIHDIIAEPTSFSSSCLRRLLSHAHVRVRKGRQQRWHNGYGKMPVGLSDTVGNENNPNNDGYEDLLVTHVEMILNLITPVPDDTAAERLNSRTRMSNIVRGVWEETWEPRKRGSSTCVEKSMIFGESVVATR